MHLRQIRYDDDYHWVDMNFTFSYLLKTKERLSMRHKTFLTGIVITILFISMTVFAQRPQEEKNVRFGISAGLGLPKIPFGQFRTPISVIGEGSLTFRFVHRWGIRLGGGALQTFSIGRINDQAGELKYNLILGTAGLMYRLGGPFGGESFITGGPGFYRLIQQFGGDEETYETMGLSIGLVQWNYRRTWSNSFELKWHFLFEPSDNPQVLTITFGILF